MSIPFHDLESRLPHHANLASKVVTGTRIRDGLPGPGGENWRLECHAR